MLLLHTLLHAATLFWRLRLALLHTANRPEDTSTHAQCLNLQDTHDWQMIVWLHMCAGSPATPDQEQRHHCEHELHDESDQQNNPDGIQCLQNHGRCGELTYTHRTLTLCLTVHSLATWLLSQIKSGPGRA